jgi:hypothetical protein
MGDNVKGVSIEEVVLLSVSRAIVAPTAKAYEAHTPLHIRKELNLVKVHVCVLHRVIDHVLVDAETGHWIPDQGYYQECATLYTRMMDLYWFLKTMMGKVLLKHSEAHEEIFLRLDEMKMELL